MHKQVKFERSNEIKDLKEYDEKKLAIAQICVLSTDENSHGFIISDEVLRRDIGTIRGNFLVADMRNGDATTHTPNEIPVGYFLPNEDIEFETVEKNGNQITKAWAYAVLSKLYAKEAYEMFVTNNHRATSIEMAVELAEDEHTVISFDAYCSTILGMGVRPSCKDAEISLVRFAEEASDFYDSKKESLSNLQSFAEERRKLMEEKKFVNHPINTFKEAIYKGEWDGQKAKQDLVKEEKFKTLAPKVCMKLEDGWEDRKISSLGYPIMGLYDGEWRYSSRGIAQALARAVQQNETSIVSKLNKIRKKLDLDESNGKEEKAEMEEVKTVEMSEETMAVTEPEKEEAEAKMEDCPCVDNDNDDDKKEEMSAEDMKAKIDQMAKDIEERDNIIMEKDKELSELREFKAGIEKKELACSVESVLSEVKDCMSEEKLSELREEGLACTKDNFAAFANKARACAFESVKGKTAKKNDEIMTFAVPNGNTKVDSTSPWD